MRPQYRMYPKNQEKNANQRSPDPMDVNPYSSKSRFDNNNQRTNGQEQNMMFRRGNFNWGCYNQGPIGKVGVDQARA